MLFIETVEDVLLPVARIATIGPEHDGRQGGVYRTITTVDGGTFTIGAASPCLKNLLGTLVKADAGYELLTAGCYDGEFSFSRHPIIAWRIGDREPEPITPSYPFSRDDVITAVLCPDGKVYSFDAGTFDTLKEWEDYEAAAKAA